MAGTASEIHDRLCDLQTTAPQEFGYLTSNWQAAKTGLDNTERAFARADTIHANIDAPDLDTRTLGYTLQILVDLDVLDADAGRNAATLYDLRTYDPDATRAIIFRSFPELSIAGAQSASRMGRWGPPSPCVGPHMRTKRL